MADATVEFSGALGIKETPLALLVDIDGKEYWIPKSQIDDDSEVWLAGHHGKLIIQRWIAVQRGLA